MGPNGAGKSTTILMLAAGYGIANWGIAAWVFQRRDIVD